MTHKELETLLGDKVDRKVVRVRVGEELSRQLFGRLVGAPPALPNARRA
jgi:hypothetical protein